ncbi:MAG: restriction endonuclease [Phycisphaerae bacterium]|nr:restriction endonuclease [Phycisphaerae bacterium]
MQLELDLSESDKYKNQSQLIRVITERWVKSNSYCPSCGNKYLMEFNNNQPVADFYCKACHEQYELKSKKGSLGNKIVDGAYSTMISRISSAENPNFFFLTYNRSNWLVQDFLVIPKYFFIPSIIERRKPLKATARRAGWVGCNILLDNIPVPGRQFIVRDSIVLPKADVVKKTKQMLFLKEHKQDSKGWTIDILNCIDRIKSERFSLSDIYAFEEELKLRHPKNNYIKDKIRQQLQLLRDKGILEFVVRGEYCKLY